MVEIVIVRYRILDYLPSYKMNGLLIRRNVDPYFGMELNFTL